MRGCWGGRRGARRRDARLRAGPSQAFARGWQTEAGGIGDGRQPVRRGQRPARVAGALGVVRGARPAPPPAAAGGAGVAPPPGPTPVPEGVEGGSSSPLNPASNEFSDAGIQAVSVDYDRLLADIASLRARVAAVSDTLFHSRIAIALETSGDHGRIASMTVSLDDGVVWTAPASFRADEPTVVYEHAVAPGHHAVTVDVERRDDRNDSFRSAQRSRFTVEVPAEQRLGVEIEDLGRLGHGRAISRPTRRGNTS